MRKKLCIAAIGALAVFGPVAAYALGNPPGTTCTGYRYGKGGGKVCIRWTYPTTTTTTAP